MPLAKQLHKFNKIIGVVVGLILVSMFTPLSYQDYASPLKQLKNGVPADEIECREGHILVIRTNGNPACVTERTAEKMSWELIPQTKVFSQPYNPIGDWCDTESLCDESETSSSSNTVQNENTPSPEKENTDGTENFVSEITDKTINEEKYEFNLRSGQTSGVKIISKGSFESALQISPANVDEFANKISVFVGDKIIDRIEITQGLRYDTERGSIKVYGDDANFTGFSYAGYPKGTTSFVEGEKITEDLLKEFGIVLDGTEFKQFRTTAHGEHYFKYIQKKDGVNVQSNIVSLSFTLGANSVVITNWNHNLSELNLIDLDKAQQIGTDYALQFDSLTSSPCNISMKDRPLHIDEISHTELRMINNTPVFVVYSGTCNLPSSLMSQDFETTVNALTGEPYHIKRGPSM